MKKITVKEARQQYKQDHGKVIDERVDGFVVLQNVGKVYGNRVQAVYDCNLSIARNEFIVLVGPSGCGKSTTLRMIAGLEEITEGKLYIDNVLANYLESKDRDIAMVFQSYALYPNMTVYDNIAFGLQVRGVPKEEIREKVFRAAEILDLGPYLDRKPKELSGGQMQRVALGRAIVRDAKLFLMDEPLSNLDAKLRVQMRSEIVKLHRNIHATTIYVTHDQTEAMTMADRIVIMNQGVVQQVGTPIEVYHDPANVFVATFIGNPPMNIFQADIRGGILNYGKSSIALPERLVTSYAAFVEERREFFADLQKKADMSEEKALCASIAEIRKTIRRLSKEGRLAAEVENILARTLDLQKKKGFFHFSEEDAQAVRDDVKNANTATVSADLNGLIEALKGCDLAVAGILKQYDSARAALTPKENDMTKNGKKKKALVESLETENRRKIAEYLAAYNEEGAETRALIGIRPEDVHFYDKFDGNKSAPVASVADLVELLGSDFCMHAPMFGADIVVKQNVHNVVAVGEEVKLCFDFDKIKIFDPVSGKAVLTEGQKENV